MKTRRRFVASWVNLQLFALLACWFVLAAPVSAAGRPNVILCMADDLGWGDTGYNGHKTLKTPNLDRLAAAGLRFDRFYAAAPVCSPTRGSALTGRHPYRYGVFFANVGHLPQEEITLAELLKEQGYATGFFGKWHLGTLSKTDPSRNRSAKALAAHYAPPWEHGFDEAFATESKVPTWDPLVDSGLRRTWWDPITDPAKGKPYGTPYYHNGPQATENLAGDDSRVIMDRAIPFIRGAVQAAKPFLAVIWFHAPHLPVVGGEKYTRPYAHLDKHTQHYYGCIAAMDEQMGRLSRELDALGAADNTMLWFCSDNGPEGNAKAPGSAGKFRGRKRSLHEGGVRVPGLLRWPAKIKPGRATNFPASTLDFPPTVADVLGIGLDSRPLDGVSLLPLIEGRMTRRPRPLFFESGNQQAVSDNQYKLVIVAPNSKRKKPKQGRPTAPPQVMLFDLLADPAETTNLAEEKPRIAEAMQAQLRAWRKSHQTSLAGEDYR